MLWQQLVRKQVVKWQMVRRPSFQDPPYIGLHISITDLPYIGGLIRNFARFRILENNLQTSLRLISTCQEIGDQAEVDGLAGQIQCHKTPRKSFSRGVRQKSQHFNSRSMCPSKGEIQQLQDEAGSDTEEELQSMHNHSDHMRGAPYDIDGSSGSMSDSMDDDEEDEARMDDSDTDSDDDGAKVITPNEILRGVQKESSNKLSEKEQDKARKLMMDKLISAALDEPDENEDEPIPEDEQHSLRVGIIGAVNAGKSSLTNFMVGTKVAAVSRKRNTTLSEILGVVTKGSTQILLYDTPGLVLDILGRPSKTDTRRRSESAWQLFSHCEVILVLVDAYRQIHKPDKRVLRLVERLGTEENPYPKRVLVLNKVDIVEDKRHLLPLAQQFDKLPGYESIFMVSALTGSGVRDIMTYLNCQAVLRPWEEEPDPLNEETIKTLSMEVVREHLLDRVHEEIPYELDHQLVDWQDLEDGSLRIEQHFYLPKKGQCRIVVGKGGSKIREIGMKACEELRKLLNRKVHLFLEVKHGGGL
eukprot:c18379_g1_i1 orf=844-2430(-)